MCSAMWGRRRLAQQTVGRVWGDILQRIIENNLSVGQTTDLMTEATAPDSDSVISADDSLFDVPELRQTYSSDSNDDSFSTVSSDSSIHSTSSTDSMWFENDDPPPPGSLLDFWDKPFAPKIFQDGSEFFPDGKVTIATAQTDEITDDDSSISSTASLDIAPSSTPVLQHISATTRVVDIGNAGELIDTGGNFNMCNDMSMLVNVQEITPFGISMAASHTKSAPTCTHCGNFPIPMLDGSVFYTPMYYNPEASDCILSPHAICRSSRGYLTKWIQEGQLHPAEGTVAFFNNKGDIVIQLDLKHRNGLFYTTTTANAINHTTDIGTSALNRTTHTQSYTDLTRHEEALLDFDCEEESANITIEAPSINPRRQQLEADLWQARLGHCGEWQLKVIPHAVEGTPAHFTPHPFSSYDHYNRARIRKIPATKGKHPSRATHKQQRFYMDFGFLRASNIDYSRPDHSKDRVIESFDGYNSYLLIVDEHTKFIWVFLCTSKEPPLEMVHLHLDIFGSTFGGSIRCDQGGLFREYGHESVTLLNRNPY